MKKIVSLFLMLVVMFSMVVPLQAKEKANDFELPKTVYVMQDDSGMYIATDKKSADLKAKMTDDYGIYETKNGDLISYTGTNSYQLVDRYEVLLTDEDAVSNILTNESIIMEIRNDIEKRSKRAILANNEEAKLVLYLPKETQIKAREDFYYEYNGYQMLDTLIYYHDISINWEPIKEGIDTNQVAQEVANILINIGGQFYKAISLFSFAENAYERYQDVTGTYPINGAYQDELRYFLKYDIYTKYTFVDKNDGMGYVYGAATQNVKLLESNILEYHVNYYGGSIVYSPKVHNTYLTTDNYYNAAQTAIDHSYGIPWTEFVEYKIYEHSINF